MGSSRTEPQSGDRLQPTAQAVGKAGIVSSPERGERNGGMRSHGGRGPMQAFSQASAPSYSGTTTTSLFGIASSVARSIPKCAITSSAGVCASHSESARS